MHSTPEKKSETIESKDFTPFIQPDQNIPEFTFKAIILGLIIGVVFGAANAYLGMKVGMTISASIPAAVISMAVLRGILRKGTILENNMVQTIASTGESVAAGIIFTVPGFLVLKHLLRSSSDGISESMLPSMPDVLITTIIACLGGCLGVLMMIPLRRYLIVKEHGKLPYPEGTACAEVLIAGEKGGVQAKHVFVGLLLGAVYKFSMSGLTLWKDGGMWVIEKFNRGAVAFDPSAALLGVGFIIGPRIAALMLAGGVVGWLVIIPILGTIAKAIGDVDPTFVLAPGTVPFAEMSGSALAKTYVRYIGAGAVAFGGLISLIKGLPVIMSSFKHSMSGMVARFKKTDGKTVEKRTDRDIAMPIILGSCVVIAIIMAVMDQIPIGIVGAIFAVIFTFFFVSVSSRIVGLIGSSSNPVSGMVITTLLIISLIMASTGGTGIPSMIAALTVGAIVCVAISCAGDISQDLKTGYLLGATPSKQQMGEVIGAVVPTMAVAIVIFLLLEANGLNTLPSYEGKNVNFTEDRIDSQHYVGEIDLAKLSEISSVTLVDAVSSGDKQVPAYLEVKTKDSRIRTSVDVLTLKKDSKTISGKIVERSSTETKILSPDNTVHSFPNAEIASFVKAPKLDKKLLGADNVTVDSEENWYLQMESPVRGVSKWVNKLTEKDPSPVEKVNTSVDFITMKDGTFKEGKIFMTNRIVDEKTKAVSYEYEFKSMDNKIEKFSSKDVQAKSSTSEKMGELNAPQANIMAMVTKGVIKGELPWVWVIIGACIAMTIELLGISSLPFAIGLYLGIGTGLPIMIGGMAVWLLRKLTAPASHDKLEQRSTLYASGIIAGDALIGILLAFVAIVWKTSDMFSVFNPNTSSSALNEWMPMIVFVALTALSFFYIFRKERDSNG